MNTLHNIAFNSFDWSGKVLSKWTFPAYVPTDNGLLITLYLPVSDLNRSTLWGLISTDGRANTADPETKCKLFPGLGRYVAHLNNQAELSGVNAKAHWDKHVRCYSGNDAINYIYTNVTFSLLSTPGLQGT